MRFYTHYYVRGPSGDLYHHAFTEVQVKEYNTVLTENGVREFDASRMMDSWNRMGHRWGWKYSLHPFNLQPPM